MMSGQRLGCRALSPRRQFPSADGNLACCGLRWNPTLRQAQGKLYARLTTAVITSAEYKGEEDPKTGVPKLLAKIKMLNKKYSTV